MSRAIIVRVSFAGTVHFAVTYLGFFILGCDDDRLTYQRREGVKVVLRDDDVSCMSCLARGAPPW